MPLTTLLLYYSLQEKDINFAVLAKEIAKNVEHISMAFSIVQLAIALVCRVLLICIARKSSPLLLGRSFKKDKLSTARK